MTDYIDHVRIAKKLLDQQGEINDLTAEVQQLRYENKNMRAELEILYVANAGHLNEIPALNEEIRQLKKALSVVPVDRDQFRVERDEAHAKLRQLKDIIGWYDPDNEDPEIFRDNLWEVLS